MEETPVTAPEQPKNGSSFGAVVAIIVIVLLVAVGGLYYFTQQVENLSSESAMGDTDASTNALMQQSASDEVADIEADINATDLSGLDAELDAIDQDLGGL